MREGWKCPCCNVIYSPDVSKCTCQKPAEVGPYDRIVKGIPVRSPTTATPESERWVAAPDKGSES